MQENTRCPRILLADDFPQILERCEKLLRNDYEIVGFARDGGEALELCLTLDPDILLLDLSMPILNGLEVATRLKELGCRSKIIFITVQEDGQRSAPDPVVLARAHVLGRSVLTLNRRHFERLDRQGADHSGIVSARNDSGRRDAASALNRSGRPSELARRGSSHG